MNSLSSGQASRTLWFVAPVLGAASEIWLQRQIDGMRRFRIRPLTWGIHEAWAPPAHTTLIGGFSPGRYTEQLAPRWGRRLLNLADGNFYAAPTVWRHRLVRLGRADPPVAICAHFGHTALYLEPVARRLGVPLLAHFHGNDLSRQLGNRWYRRSLEVKLPSFDAIVVVGSHQRRWVLDHGAPAERVHLIPCGAPIENFRAEPTRRPKHPVFITVSRLHRTKGVHLAIEAFARIAERHPGAELRIVGDGPERQALETQAKSLGRSGISFLGRLPPEEVRRELNRATAFLQHSLDLDGWNEGFGVSITEAAAMQLPVVVSDCGGIADQVIDDETGYIVSQGDVVSMAERMERLASDRHLARRMGEAGQLNAAAFFDAQKQIAKLEQVIIDRIATRSSPRSRMTPQP